MAQYLRLRGDLPPDTVLFFRLGDFYEMFYDDAKEVSQLLDLTLTKRQTVPMCGVPFHSADGYLAKLIRAGKKVAICEQMEDPAMAKGLVRREITRVVTPGTVLEDGVLESNRNNYLAGLCLDGEKFGAAFLDLSTGALWIEEGSGLGALAENLSRYAPSECVVAEERKDEYRKALPPDAPFVVTGHEDWTFEFDAAADLLRRHFNVHSLDGFGCEGMTRGLRAAGAILHYVQKELRRPIEHVRQLRVKHAADFMLLDETTIRNLDLVENRSGNAYTLLGVLDATRTAMGARLLRDWMLRPLTREEEICRRLDAVEAFTKDRRLLLDLREALAEIKDLERLIARLNAGAGNARDVRALGQSLAALPNVQRLLPDSGAAAAPLLVELRSQMIAQPELVALVERAIVDEPPMPIKEGGMIRTGYHAELDELRDAASQGRAWLAEYQAREQERTGIKSLKVRHNSVFGFYIEITKSNLDAAPPEYVRKQTLVNAERFITPELKEYENKIMGAQEKSMALEYELFLAVRGAVLEHTAEIQRAAAALAALDALASLADRAVALRYTRPRVHAGDVLRIREGRHPVIEAMPNAERFVPNDTFLNGSDHQIAIITGPNMAGKSTYIRQVAAIVVMAQVGSFVPAAEAEVGLCDRVFTRVGASDDLARGRSTFMVEMQETANILNNATPRSLIVLDEIGRGTSTFDGISIAWAVAEYLHNHAATKAKTLFATHYHELTDLALTLSGVKNFNVLVRESGERIVFLRKIAPGGADKSYGIQVARLAGLPPEVIGRAREILGNLEEGEFSETGQPKLAQRYGKKGRADPNQLTLFGERPATSDT